MLSRIVKCGMACLVAAALGILLHLWHLHGSPAQEGVLATVNGHPITAHQVQLYVDIRHPLGSESSLDDMRRAHAQALGSLIVARLVEQSLREADLLPDTATLDMTSKKMLEEYPAQELANMFSENAISETDWLGFMRDTQIAVIFEQEILQKRMDIDLSAVRSIYESDRDAFAMPETFRLCSFRSRDKATVEGVCSRLGTGNAVTDDAAHTPFPVCVTVDRKELPDALQPLAQKGKTNVCTRVEQIDDFWQAGWLLRADKAATVSLPEAFAIIETLLREREKYTTFATWLEEIAARTDIRLAPEIAPELLNLQNGEKGLSNSVTKKSDAKQGK